MSSKAKFLFDTDFNRLAKSDAADAAPARAFSEAELAAARQEGLQEGLRLGAEQTRAQIESFAADTLRSIAKRVAALDAEQQRLAAKLRAEATRLAHAIAAKLAPELIRRQPLAEIEGLIRTCLAEMPTEPRVVVRVAEPLVEPLTHRMDAVAAESGFEGKLVLLGEPSIALGDCRVEWADGGIERDSQALAASIEAAVVRFADTVLAADGAAGREPGVARMPLSEAGEAGERAEPAASRALQR